MHSSIVSTTCIIIFASLVLQDACNAYILPLRRPKSNFGGSGGSGNNGSPPRPFDFFRGDDSDGDKSPFVAGMLLLLPTDSSDLLEPVRRGSANETSSDEGNAHITLRGGGAIKKQSDNVISYLKKMLPFAKADNESDEKQQEEILKSTIVTEVTASTSDLLPPEVLTLSAEHAKLIGGKLTPETLDATAKSINNWYASQGYVMNSVTGATLVPSQNDQGRVELKVREAKVTKLKDKSVVIRFVEPCDDESDKSDEIINLPLQSESSGRTEQYEQYRITSGRTRTSKLAKIVGLTPGSHFRIIPQRWSRIVANSRGIFGSPSNVGGSNSIFSSIHAIRPMPEDDGSISVEIIATENKPFASIEYGVTKSLYSDQWEGELDLKHANAFGGGEIATLSVKKGRGNSKGNRKGLGRVTGGPTSWRMSISDESLSDTGYILELFRDNVGTFKDKESGTERTGAIMQVRMPRTVSPRAVSARFEQIEQTQDSSAPMQTASTTMNIGPINFLHSGLSAVLTCGVQRDAAKTVMMAKPYFMGSVTSRKIIPLCPSPFTSGDQSKPYMNLAMRHVATSSTNHLPRHEAIVLGLSSRVRGYRYNKKSHTKQSSWGSFLQLSKNDEVCPPAAVANSVCGNIELRVPFRPVFNDVSSNLNALSSMLEGSIVAFGDWAFSQTHFSEHDGQAKPERLVRSSSVGVGYRKIAQGLPFKVDAVITEHGTGGIFFGIGRDFA